MDITGSFDDPRTPSLRVEIRNTAVQYEFQWNFERTIEPVLGPEIYSSDEPIRARPLVALAMRSRRVSASATGTRRSNVTVAS